MIYSIPGVKFWTLTVKLPCGAIMAGEIEKVQPAAEAFWGKAVLYAKKAPAKTTASKKYLSRNFTLYLILHPYIADSQY